MKILNRSLSLIIVALSLAFTLARPASAQIVAKDDAAAYTGATWTNNSNLGFGFTPWTLLNTNSGPGFSGFYIGNPGGIGTGGNSFGMYANGGTSNAAVAF